MNSQSAVTLINQFNEYTTELGQNENKQISEALSQERSTTLPPELIQYIDTVCSDNRLTLTSVGHPVTLYAREELSWTMPGFNIDIATKAPLENWQNSWLVFAVDGDEPIFVNVSEQTPLSKVYSAMKTQSGWDVAVIADSIGQFLLCICAIDHALNFPNITEPLDEDFNLAPEIAKWFFPLIKQHASNHFDEWAAVFENYLDDFS